MMIYAILLLGLALAFVLAEVLLPSGGILTVGAIASIAGAVAIAFGQSYQTGFAFLVVVALSVPLVMIFGLKLFPRTPVGKRMINAGLSFESTPATDSRDLELIGRVGEVLTPLRPAGHARFEGRRVDVVSRGESIEPGERVRVLEVRGNRVVVVRDATKNSDQGA